MGDSILRLLLLVLLLLECYYYYYTVSTKRHPFYFCKNLAKYYPISIIFGSSIPEEICNKNMHVYPPHLFTVLIPYLVKLDSTYLCLHCFYKWPFYCVQQVCLVPSNLIILADMCQKNFVTKLLRHSAHQTWLYVLQLYLVKLATV